MHENGIERGGPRDDPRAEGHGMRKDGRPYHHGNLAESLLDAVDETATRFGLEAVTLRGCARQVGVSPSSAFRHYADKRALLTAFATRALHQLTEALLEAGETARREDDDPLRAVALAYVRFAIDRPAFFRAMWREETIYAGDAAYAAGAEALRGALTGGFAGTLEDADPTRLDTPELLAWSAVHGLASLMVDGPVERGASREARLATARDMVDALSPVFARAARAGG